MNWTIRYNTIINTGWDGFNLAGSGRAYGNFIDNVVRGFHLDLARGPILVSGNMIQTLRILSGQTVAVQQIRAGNGSFHLFQLDYNYYPRNSTFVTISSVRLNSLAKWQQTTGYDMHSKEIDEAPWRVLSQITRMMRLIYKY